MNEKRTWERHKQLLLEEFGITAAPVIEQTFIKNYNNVVNWKQTFDEQLAELWILVLNESGTRGYQPN